ncbi:MAG: lipoyl(octanoyl) transferase LipB [Gemmataceae bacterium]
MISEPISPTETEELERVLQVYLLGRMDFEIGLQLQRRLVYEVSAMASETTAGPVGGSLILCEHPPVITVGRQGSYVHILCDEEEMRARQWRSRWVNRGGGCFLQVPGQLAIYSILPLEHLGLSLPKYINKLQEVLLLTLSDFLVQGTVKPDHGGIRVRNRLVADIGVAVRDWVSYYGAVLNINPVLDQFKDVRCGGPDEEPMTSIERERHGPLSPPLVRQRILEHFQECFGFTRMSLFTDHPLLRREPAPSRFALPKPSRKDESR